MGNIPSSLWICFGYCVSQPSSVGSVLAHMYKCKATAVTVRPNTRASWFPTIAGAEVSSVQIASKDEDSQFFRVHHQRAAEPYTVSRGGMRAVEVEFKWNLSLYEENHERHEDIQHACTDKRAHVRIVVHPPRLLTPKPVHSAHFDDAHRNRPVHGNNAYARPAGLHLSPTLAPIGHVRQALRNYSQ